MGDSADPHMLKWWAQYTESTGDMNGALKIYQKAEDWFSQVLPFLSHTHILCQFRFDLKQAF